MSAALKLINEFKAIYKNDTRTIEDELNESITTLEFINEQIADLTRVKEGLESRLYDLFNHHDDGQKTYTHGTYKVLLKTGYNYRVEKGEYEVYKGHIPECFNPVKEKVEYIVDKKTVKDVYKYGDQNNIDMIDKIIKTTPAKLYCKITRG